MTNLPYQEQIDKLNLTKTTIYKVRLEKIYNFNGLFSYD